MLRDLLENSSVVEVVATFVALSLIVATVLCLFYIIIGGITFILSAGNEEKIKKAVQTIRFAIVGLFICFIAFFAVSFIARLVDIPFDLSFALIVDLMTRILDSLK